MLVGDAFGYSDLLKVVGPEYLGEIRVAGDAEAECLILKDPDGYIQLFERKVLQSLMLDDYLPLKRMLEAKHRHLGETLKK